MAKKIVVSNSQVPSNTISGAGQVANSAIVVFDMMPESNPFYSSHTKIGRKGKDTDDELLSDEGAVVDTEQVVTDSVYADLEYEILLSQVDAAPQPYTIYNTDNVSTASINASDDVAQKNTGTISGGAAIWWWGGAGVAAIAAGVGLSSSGGGGSAKDPVNTAPVITNEAPTLVALQNTTSALDENIDTTVAIKVANIAVTDDALGSNSITLAGPDAAHFEVVGIALYLKAGTTLNYENKGSYDVTVSVGDATVVGSTSVTIDFTLTINDVNEAPVIISPNPNNGNVVSLSINEGIATVATVFATDVDAGQTITYSLSGADSTLFTINSSPGVVTFTTAPVYNMNMEGKNTYNFTVIAKDNGTGELSDQQDFSVTVIDLAVDPPIFLSVGMGSVDENAFSSTVVYVTNATGEGTTYSLKDATGDFSLLNINATNGQVTLKTSADFESKASYNFIVIAENGSAIAEQPVIISVNDLNEEPTTTAVTLTAILEDSGARLITQAELLINAFDDDGDDLTASELAISGGTGTLVDNEDGTWSYTPALNADTPVSFSYKITDGTLISDGSATMLITPVNDAPMITSNGGGSTANISIAATRTVVTTVTAEDVDSDNLRYSIANVMDGALFHIDPSTGALTFTDAPIFNEESTSENTYSVQVIVSDGYLTCEQDITVSVTNYKNVVVESSGAYIDLAGETILADFTPDTGNVDLVLNPVTIHYNAAPNNPLNLSGFGIDDLIEIDAQAFIANGHHILNILALPNIKTLDAFSTHTSKSPGFNQTSTVYNTYTTINTGAGTSYANSNSYSGVFSALNAKIGLRLQDQNTSTRTLLLFSTSQSATQLPWVLAAGLPTDMSLQDVVDFVNLPVQSAIVHVVVDSDGAVIDIDGDGVRDIGENRLANFETDGNADLAGKSVVIHFNDIPMSALNLTGFGTEDKIQIDTGHDSWIDDFNTGSNSVLFGLAHHEYFSGPTPAITTVKTGIGFKHTVLGRGSVTYSGDPGSGTIAYWTDSANALNNPANLLKNYTALGGTKSYNDVLAKLNANHYPGLVEFVWPVDVVVDNENGHVASFIDNNANGLRDGGEDTLALIGQTTVDVDAFNAAAGTNYGWQVVDLASENVTIHYNDLPSGNWVPDLTGFDGNDRIEIDVDALRQGVDNSLNNQNTNPPFTSWADTYGIAGCVNGNSRSSIVSAVFLSGSKLVYGHVNTSGNGYYTASGVNEGTIASNAAALAGQYQQQVVFVMAGGGPI